jgi:hypothetical protein
LVGLGNGDRFSGERLRGRGRVAAWEECAGDADRDRDDGRCGGDQGRRRRCLSAGAGVVVVKISSNSSDPASVVGNCRTDSSPYGLARAISWSSSRSFIAPPEPLASA